MEEILKYAIKCKNDMPLHHFSAEEEVSNSGSLHDLHAAQFIRSAIVQ